MNKKPYIIPSKTNNKNMERYLQRKLSKVGEGGGGDGSGGKSPYIGENGHWFEWDAEQQQFVDTGVTAQGPQGQQGIQGNTGSNVAYPFELVNNRTTNDPEKALSAAEGYRIGEDITQLEAKVTGLELQPYNLCREVQVGTLIDSNGAEYANNSRCRTGFIEVEPNTDYQIYSLAGVNGYTTPIFEYAEDKSFIQKTTWTMTSYNYFTTGPTTKYIRTKSSGDVALSDYRVMVEKGRVRTYFFDLTEMLNVSVPYLDKEVGGINKRLQALDGIVSTNAAEFEIGDITASGSNITYGNNTKRVRLKKFITIELAAGSSIWLTNYTNARFVVIQLRDGGSYYTSAWQQSEYIVEEHAFCTLLLSNVPEVNITDVASLAELVRIKDASGKVLQIDGLLVDMADVKSRLSAVEGLTGDLATEDINYEYGKLNATGVDKGSFFAHSEYIEATVGDVIEWKYSNGSVISYGFTVYDAEYNIISTYSGNVNTGIRTITITEAECAYIRASFARDLISECYVKKNGIVVYKPHMTSLGLADQLHSIESQSVIADYSAYSDFLKRGNFYFCQTKLQAGKQYHIDCTGNRTATTPAYIFIRETVGDSATDISDCLAEFSGEFSFSGDYVSEDECYIGLWLNGGGACSIYQFTLYEIGGGEENEASYKNLDLAMAAKKRLLTSEQQTEAGMTASVHNNNVSSLHQIVHITDMHGDWTRVKRAVSVAELLDADLVNSGDTTLENGTEDISGYESAIAQFAKQYVHCIGNHDSWGLTLASQVASKFITPFATERNWTVPSVTDATYFFLDDTGKKIRFISVDQWVKYDEVQTGSYCYGQSQIDWLISTLASVPNDYGVIVVIHCPDRQLAMTQGYTKFYQKTRFSGSMGLNGITPISSIIDAWISKTSISETMTSPQETITINADFSSRTKSEFIAYITGHTHQDGICYLPNTTNRQLVLCSTTGNCKYNTTGNELAETSDLARFTEGELQDAFNVYTIDRVAKVVKVVRIGSDMPFDFSERRDCMAIPY